MGGSSPEIRGSPAGNLRIGHCSAALADVCRFMSPRSESCDTTGNSPTSDLTCHVTAAKCRDRPAIAWLGLGMDPLPKPRNVDMLLVVLPCETLGEAFEADVLDRENPRESQEVGNPVRCPRCDSSRVERVRVKQMDPRLDRWRPK